MASIDSVAASEDMNDSSHDIKDMKNICCQKGSTNVKKRNVVSDTREVIGEITFKYRAS